MSSDRIYKEAVEGEWVECDRLWFKCCDCGLVHLFKFERVAGKTRICILSEEKGEQEERDCLNHHGV